MAVQPSPVPVPPVIPDQEPPPALQPEKPRVRMQTTVLTILLFVVIALAVGVIFYFDQLASLPFVQRWLIRIPESEKQNVVLPPTPHTPTPKPTPSYLPPGKQTYTVSQTSDANLPKIQSLTLDPINVKMGEEQTLEVVVLSSTPVRSVNLTLYADDKQKQSIALTLSSSDGQNSIWRAKWTVNYSVWYRYVTKIDVTNTDGANTAYVAPRTVGPIRKTDLD